MSALIPLTVKTLSGPLVLEGVEQVSPHFAVHPLLVEGVCRSSDPDGWDWVVTHIPTGYRITMYHWRYADACALALSYETAPVDWSQSDPDVVSGYYGEVARLTNVWMQQYATGGRAI